MKSIKVLITGCLVFGLSACTKLDQKLQSSYPFVPSSGAAASLLNGTYSDLVGLLHGQDQIFSLQENTGDMCLVPTRGGDWDDNGVWRVLHAHTWPRTHSQFISVFNGLGKLESDAIATLASSPTAAQADEALFLKSVAQFYYVDLFGQVPYRLVSEYNSIKPAPVLQPAAAVDTLVAALNGIISRNALPASNVPYRASVDAAKFLLMKVLLNKGAYINRAAPTFADADMQQVITLGNQLITSGKYSLTPNYFDNFGPNNATTGKEAIWSWPNNGSASNNGVSSGGINARWMMTLHYNSWDKNNVYGSAGWNGFSTVADFYNTFEGHGDATANTVIDTTKDKRIGGKFYPGVTDQSGLRPGLLAGLQKNENGVGEVDRKGNPLTFTPTVNLVETNANTLEIAGIRIVKYPPDYTAYNGGNQRNQLQIFRYADVMLMVAEAYLRAAAPNTVAALALVNQIRTARGASVWTSVPLVNASNVADPNTLLAERGRELYWESWRRQDLIRFGVYLKPWALKTADDPKNLLFPIPSDQLIANPNLKQNPGY
ncbi:MAG TPA: RagB/SusD family nutrient uptake outer membrane protein [Flavisolibacter sp.]|nr:RagB/SusD family nutrient uptake outer membrane protein [Flavisolibacter sp.]